MSCCDGIIKYLLFFFNLLFALSGLALIVIGSMQLVETSSFAELIQDLVSGMKAPQIFIIVVGVIIFFIATLGCCGAVRENRCKLITFAILLLTLFIIQLAIGIYALTNKPEFKSRVQRGLDKQFQKIPLNPKVQEMYEGMERHMECCGVNGTADYAALSRAVPLSCCSDRADCKIKPNTYWTVGCSQALSEFSGKAGQALGGAAVGLSFIEILNFSLPICVQPVFQGQGQKKSKQHEKDGVPPSK